MVAYEKFNYEAREENEENPQGTRKNGRAYGLDLFVRDALDARGLYSSTQNSGNRFSSYLRTLKNKKQREYGLREKKVDPLELLASISTISSYGFGNRAEAMGYGGSVNSLFNENVGDYSGETSRGYSSSRGIALGDYSSDRAGASYAAADAGHVDGYSSN